MRKSIESLRSLKKKVNSTIMLINGNPLVLAILASFFFALSTFISKAIGMGLVGDPVHPFQVSHARFGFGLVGASLLLLYSRKNVRAVS